ncbi:helix-hairpin-helix domain-containing protein [Solitalea canadensis]|uniref:DNA uptake protein n=1 Tax=Solitalea canadensis (strain ATCC 29591 / DSM 3403 / JCM 21819 / LMG 8368 / NBRC 15130 / NCIMB 12057 / USAM 9D) TaxID=929556 RepID=H8KP22_SOLCM|nr:helix-hairpin-helix domain-containing protein [Solitalea canadensis]AFD05544.1 DNA uptake protein [Solitalea canadensis DSM 3403]
MKSFLKTWFSFSRKELNGLFVLMLICFITIISTFCFPSFFTEPPTDFSSFKKEIREFEANNHPTAIKPHSFVSSANKESTRNIKLTSFDPNTLLYKDWLQLGFSERQATVVMHYLEKGGRFRKKEDIKKIYSFSQAQYEQLAPYIVIGSSDKVVSSISETLFPAKSEKIIELNAADSLQLISLKGIGPVLARRIIKYRDRLGGFYAKEQLKDVYGLDSLVYLTIERSISVDLTKIKLTNINTASFNELRHYPYLTNKQINALLNFRKQHGLFSLVNDIIKYDIIDNNTFNKILPYLSID